MHRDAAVFHRCPVEKWKTLWKTQLSKSFPQLVENRVQNLQTGSFFLPVCEKKRELRTYVLQIAQFSHTLSGLKNLWKTGVSQDMEPMEMSVFRASGLWKTFRLAYLKRYTNEIFLP